MVLLEPYLTAIGIPIGHILQIGLTCFGLANLIFNLSSSSILYENFMFFIFTLLRVENDWFLQYGSKETGRPLKFYEASLFQFINPKAWSIAVTVASGFFPSEENIFIGVSFVTITAAVICFPTISLWALFGSGLRKFINNTKIKKIIEYLLATLLVLTGLFILLK